MLSPYKDFVVSQGSYDLWDASLRYDSPTRRWYLALYGTNLEDQVYAHWNCRDAFRGVSNGWGPPRTVGLAAGVRY